MRALPQWFELEGGLLELVEAARTSPTFVATESGADVGFLTLKAQTRQAAEITAMGVLPNWHRHGIGRSVERLWEKRSSSHATKVRAFCR